MSYTAPEKGSGEINQINGGDMIYRAHKVGKNPAESLMPILDSLQDVGCDVTYSLKSDVRGGAQLLPDFVSELSLDVFIPDTLSDEVKERILFMLTDDSFIVNIEQEVRPWGS